MSDAPHNLLRLVGAALLLFGGAIHTWLAFDSYGTADLEKLFLLNGIGSAVIAAAIVVTRGPVAPLVGVGISGASLLAFALSRVGDGVVGFRATGLEPMPEAPLTLVVEGAALVVLGVVVIAGRRLLVDTVSDALPNGS